MIKNASLRTKLIFFGTLTSVLPLLCIIFISFINNAKIKDVAAEESLKLAYSDLDHILENVRGMGMAQQGLAQEMIDNALKTSRNILEETGQVSLSEQAPVTWNAVNQYTKKAVRVELPGMFVGQKWLGQNTDMQQPSLIVDKTRDLSVETCTLFQRMNAAGDMLRISTNVAKLDGSRAIGTYIPAINPDGTSNPVIASVLSGKTFRGRAFVVNAWYLTAYEPIFDKDRHILGILYVGIKQATIEKSLVRQIAGIKVGKTGNVFVVNSKGDCIVSQNNRQDGENLWNLKDADGTYFLREIIRKARSAKTDKTQEHRYTWKSEGQKPRLKIARIKYFKDWDWVIAAGAYADEFLESRDKINAIGNQSNMIAIGFAGISLCFAGLASLLFSKNIAARIHRIAAGLAETSDQVAATSGQFSSVSRQLTEGANVQAASIEETSASLEEMSSMTKQNADNAAHADELMKTTNQVVGKANDSLTQLTEFMNEISVASEETSKIIKSIDEIAFQTNLLALNAAVEAARAGEAGAGFAVVADEVRNLALRAADAARNTAVLIEGTVTKTKEGTTLVVETNDAFIEVATDTDKVGNLISEIAAASIEQAQGIEQINTAVNEIDKVTQQNAANAEESAASSGQMTAQAGHLQKMVDRLVALVGKDTR